MVVSIVTDDTVTGVALLIEKVTLDVPAPVSLTKIDSRTHVLAAIAMVELAQVAVVPLP